MELPAEALRAARARGYVRLAFEGDAVRVLPSSGSFTVRVEVEASLSSVEELRWVAEMALRELGASTHEVVVDGECRVYGGGRFRAPVAIRCARVEDELSKWDAGLYLDEQGRPVIRFADFSSVLGVGSFRPIAERLERLVAKYARVATVVRALGVAPTQVEVDQGRVVVVGVA